MVNTRIFNVTAVLLITVFFLSGTAAMAQGSNTPWGKLQESITAFSSFLWPAATALAAVGLLTMTILEFLKNINFVFANPFYRGNFHRVRFKKMIKNAAVRQDIIKLATAGNEDALYDLPIGKFTGQINAAMQIVLADPQRFEAILRAILPEDVADPDDINVLADGPLDDPKPFTDARVRIGNLIQRRLDAIQIDWGNQWARFLQRSSILISSFIIFGCGYWYSSTQNGSFPLKTLFFWVVLALVGGAFAPIAKNLVANLKTLKDRAK